LCRIQIRKRAWSSSLDNSHSRSGRSAAWPEFHRRRKHLWKPTITFDILLGRPRPVCCLYRLQKNSALGRKAIPPEAKALSSRVFYGPTKSRALIQSLRAGLEISAGADWAAWAFSPGLKPGHGKIKRSRGFETRSPGLKVRGWHSSTRLRVYPTASFSAAGKVGP
jgi:hypothetical protein